MLPVSVDDLVAYIGDEPKYEREAYQAQARQVLNVITAWVQVHTRGVGFDVDGPNDALRGVILTASARLMDNNGLDGSVTIDDSTIRKAAFTGWTLAELAVLNAHRRRTA